MDLTFIASLGSFIDDLVNFLKMNAPDPLTFSIILFFYAVMASVFLPIPVEVALILSPNTPVFLVAIVLGLGKMVGSVLVFTLGLKVGDKVRHWSTKWRWFSWLVVKIEWIVTKFHYLGLYLIMSIPFMFDTVPLYIFSLFNERGTFKMRYFALTNFLAGVTRAFIILILLHVFQISLF
jgi:hypothetical protein